ncbi:hypothetical protein [Staphylothermus hellenicus]|uniref:Uncharacterized protein n=1 Tax=Staphylothermus hellenicus (strain DSM 12710 / JCM 10830 / BK20S6-10-b1 / P8) TaxID=591019 RepID=D7D8N0_STAHD|nr:hypothetical protein [Staphylothermus hellenicus]ADI32126.1 hypothetical protein Shell_1021 [Staphylothermus hellenicus DSM 12710]
MDSVLGDFLACLGRIPYYVGNNTARIFNILSREKLLPNIETIYGFSNIIMELENKSERYIVGYIYRVDHASIEKLSSWDLGIYRPIYSELNGLFITKYKNFRKIFERIGNEFLKKKWKDMLKKEYKCWMKKDKICFVSTNKMLLYKAGYLSLAIKCKGKTLIIDAFNLAENMLKSIYYPAMGLLDSLYHNNIPEDLVRIVSEQIINYYTELISKFYIRLPKQFDVSDLLRLYTQLSL